MTAWRQGRFAVIDLETTGLKTDVHEVLSVGIVHIDRGVIRADSAYFSLVRPRTAPDADTIVVHGIRPADLDDAPEPATVAAQVRTRLRGRVPVAHVAMIEQRFLHPWLPDHPDFVDTDCLMRLHLARIRDLALPDHVGLGAAAQWFGLPEHRRHHALGDALTTAQLFLALATALDTSVPGLLDAERALAKEHRRLKRHRMLSRFRTPKKKETT